MWRPEADLWVRHVLVPGLTDDADGLRQLDAFIKTLPTVRRRNSALPHAGIVQVAEPRHPVPGRRARTHGGGGRKPRSSFCMCAIIPMHLRAAPQSNFYKKYWGLFWENA